MKVQIRNTSGIYLKDYGDGSDGKKVPTFCCLISLKQDGTTFQTVDSILSRTLDMVSTTQSTFIITTCILMFMSNLDKQEVLKELIKVNSSRRVNSQMSPDGD